MLKIVVSLLLEMESEGELYQIKKFPSVYYFHVLRFAADLLHFITGFELKKSEKAKEFEDACYLWSDIPDFGVHKDILKFIATEVVCLNSVLNEKGFLGPYVDIEKLSSVRLEAYYRLVARLEFYGFICQSPRSLKVNCEGEICLDFLSDWAKKVIIRAVWRVKGISRFIDFQYGWFMRHEKEFKRPVTMVVKENGTFEVKRQRI